MNRIAFFIDGFNLFHALDNNHLYHKYKWLDLNKLSNCFVTKKDKIENIYYFTALATWSQSKMKKHKTYLKALELKNIKTIYGEFRKKENFVRCVKEHIKHLKKNRLM